MNATVWEFGIAIIVLWYAMEYVPGGLWIGLSVLLVTFLSTPAATQATVKFLSFVENPLGVNL